MKPKKMAKENSRPRKPKAKAGRERARSTLTHTVTLRPTSGWHKRNFITEVFLPSLFSRRTGEVRVPEFAKLKPGELCITWIGHASFLVRTHGRNILIDPNWANWLKVIKRQRKPGMQLHDLPEIDLVLITHAHFDHLDRKTLRTIARDQPIIVPFGVANLVHDLGFREVFELDEWDEMAIDGMRLTLTPCSHWGARVLHDSHRGYGGYLIETDGRSVFHCGDSAYFEGFRELGARKDIEIALLPIGAYDAPSGRSVHMNPEEAVQTFLDLKAKIFIPMHYGSFRLSYEPLDEPPSRLVKKARESGISDRIRFLTEGVPVVF